MALKINMTVISLDQLIERIIVLTNSSVNSDLKQKLCDTLSILYKQKVRLLLDCNPMVGDLSDDQIIAELVDLCKNAESDAIKYQLHSALSICFKAKLKNTTNS